MLRSSFRSNCVILGGGEIILSIGWREGVDGDADRFSQISDRARGRRAAMRENTRVRMGPEPGIERIEPLFAPCLHGDAPAFFKRFLDEIRQHLFEGLTLQMIKPNFGHDAKNKLGEVANVDSSS